MNKQEIQKEIETTFSPVFRMIERNEIMFYQLLKVLKMKGILTDEDFDKYLSQNAIDMETEKINKILSGDGIND